jgi:hypothetical protein
MGEGSHVYSNDTNSAHRVGGVPFSTNIRNFEHLQTPTTMKETLIVIGMIILITCFRCRDRRDELTERQNNNENNT